MSQGYTGSQEVMDYLYVDHLGEKTSGHGIAILNNAVFSAGLTLSVDHIAEAASGHGVNIDGVLLKDSVVTASLTGNVTGDVTGNCSGSSASCTGSSKTLVISMALSTGSFRDQVPLSGTHRIGNLGAAVYSGLVPLPILQGKVITNVSWYMLTNRTIGTSKIQLYYAGYNATSWTEGTSQSITAEGETNLSLSHTVAVNQEVAIWYSVDLSSGTYCYFFPLKITYTDAV